MLPWTRAVCAAARSPSTQSASSARSAFALPHAAPGYLLRLARVGRAQPVTDIRRSHCMALYGGQHDRPFQACLKCWTPTLGALCGPLTGWRSPGLLPGGATPHGSLEKSSGLRCQPSSLPPGERKAGVRDLARRSFRWRVPLRWYLISLLAPLLIFLIAVTILYGFAPLRALGQNWLLLFTAFLPALAIMILLNNVAEEIGWTGFVFARFQDRHGPLRAALLTTVFFWLFHVPSFYVETRSWATTALVLGIFLLPHLGSRLITGWLYNGAGSSVLIAGLFHSMHNAIVNSTGLVAVVGLPQFEVLVIMAGIVVRLRRSSPSPPEAVSDSSDPNQMPI